MREAHWTREDLREIVPFAAIFAIAGIVIGSLSYGDPIGGALAGLLLLLFVMGIGTLAGVISNKFNR
jgi:ABC-type transport system involved in cytochrome bd biosynthesis fused ATPase/permease subunit